VISTFPDNNSTIEVIATRDIEEGEEVNLCYLDDAEDLDLEARQAALRDFYLFECACERCQQEKAAALETGKGKKGKTTKRKRGQDNS